MPEEPLFRKVMDAALDSWRCDILESREGEKLAVCYRVIRRKVRTRYGERTIEDARAVTIPSIIFETCSADLYMRRAGLPKYAAEKLAELCRTLVEPERQRHALSRARRLFEAFGRLLE